MGRMGNIAELARRRVSVRAYVSEPINLQDVIYAITAASQAPSGANTQPWRFILVTDSKLKKKIREECERYEREFHERAPLWMRKFFNERNITWRKPFLTDAPILIVVFGRKTAPYFVQSVWLSIGYLLLALEERGLASLTYTPPRVSWVNELLKVPKEYVLQAIIPVGKPLDKNSIKRRLDLSEILFFNKWKGEGDL